MGVSPKAYQVFENWPHNFHKFLDQINRPLHRLLNAFLSPFPIRLAAFF
jgi:hypothetical protein